MTTMDPVDFQRLGLNRNESLVYAALLRLGRADAGRLIKETKFHKNIVYDNLEKLAHRGLVTIVQEGGRRVYQFAPPHTLVSMIEDRQGELERQKELAQRLVGQIAKLPTGQASEQDAAVYRGVQGARAFYDALLDEGEYLAFGGPRESVNIMGESFWSAYNRKLARRRLRIRLLFNRSLRAYGKRIADSRIEIRYFDGDFEPLTETIVNDHRVAIIVWTSEPFVFSLRSPAAAQSYKLFAADLWRRAKR